jgi:sarcosine oxidase gamma subunit
VRCFLQGGGPAFVPFTVTVSASSGAGLRYAYVHGTNAAVAVSYNSTGGVSAVTTLGPGEWLVWLPGPARPRRRAGCRSCGQPGQPVVCDVARRWSVT